MPPRTFATVDKILEYTLAAGNVLQEVAGATKIPFLERICTFTSTIIPMVQNTKFQKERSLRIVECIHHLLCVLRSLSIQSEDIQSPQMLHQIAQVAVTLQKVDSCLRAQQELGTIRRLFKQSELIGQLDACETELNVVLTSFTTEQMIGFTSTVIKFNMDTETRHHELLELISTQSGSFDTMSSVGILSAFVFQVSFDFSDLANSGSFSLLPASPKVFHGRESELEHLVDCLLADPARVAILGPGGMGKTSLAVTALHNSKVIEKYPTRHFIPCDSVQTNDSLVATIASYLGLETSRGSARHIVHHLSIQPPCLLALDSFETPWEPTDSRAKVEEFLALLTDIPHVALLITMRGAERPSKVQWTHPFLHPLSPLSPSAAYQTFIEIADEIHDLSEVDKLLELTDNIPLAVQLVANIVASEGSQATLERWKVESTALLSTGYDKQSNLETSIKLSLSSPRLASLPHAVDLLSLMSLLSDGISDTDLVQSKLPIPEILKCKTTLVRTSLAYVDQAGRLKVLAPIRDYIQTVKPPAPDFVRPLRKYLNDLLRLWKTVMDSSSDLGETIQAIISLNQLNLLMNRGLSTLMRHLHEMLPQIDDHRLHGQFIVEAFRARWFYAIPNPDKYMDEAIEHFRIVNDIEGEARLYTMVARYYADNVHDHKKAQELYQHALTLASQCNSHLVQVGGLIGLAIIESLHGTWSEGLHLSRKAQKIALAAGNLRGELNSLQCQTRCYMGLGDFKHGIQVVNEWKALVLRAGIQGGESEFILMNFEAEVYHLKTEYTEARQFQEVILSHTSPVVSPIGYAYTLVNIAFLDLVTGGSRDAVSHNLQNALNIFQRVQYPRGILLCEVHAVDLKLREGNTTGVCAKYKSAFVSAYSTDNELACYCLAKLADSIHPVHADSEVSKWAVIFLAFVMRPRERSILPVHQALQRLGDVFAQQGNTEEALSILTVTLEGFTWMDVHRNRAECMQTIGDVHFRNGDLSAASTFWMAARPLFERSLQAQAVMEINARLVEVERHHEANLEQLSKLAVPTEPLQQLSIQAEVLVHRDKDPDVNTNKIGAEGASV
ncbi:hypothetical protein B0H14DRAFT_3161809 [Mycena olivaceomarginata]|nr:hypothetical protein B0H14DRAFT_3161809 [Mycena olivaceomarginata]